MDEKVLAIIETLEEHDCTFSQLREFMKAVDEKIPEWEIRIRQFQDSGQILETTTRCHQIRYRICGYDPYSRMVFLKKYDGTGSGSEWIERSSLELCIAGFYRPVKTIPES